MSYSLSMRRCHCLERHDELVGEAENVAETDGDLSGRQMPVVQKDSAEVTVHRAKDFFGQEDLSSASVLAGDGPDLLLQVIVHALEDACGAQQDNLVGSRGGDRSV
jgi:hypothetical protein